MPTKRLQLFGPCVRSVLLLLAAAASVVADDDIEYVEPDDATGASQAVIVGDVPLAHTAQLLPLDPQGSLVGKGQAATQATQVLDSLAAALNEAKSGLDRVVKINVYATAPEVVTEVRHVFADRFRGPRKPAVSFVLTRLGHPDALVAMDAVAVAGLEPGRAVKQLRNSRLHDSGTSHVAIVPSGTRVYVAGQAEKGQTLAEATRLTLDSLRATLKHLGQRDTDIAQLKCFLRPMSDAADVRRELASFFGRQPVPPVALVEWESSLPIEIELIAWGGHDQAGDAVEFLTPPGMSASPVFSRVARTNHSRSIYVSGLYATNVENAEAEVEQVLSSLGRVLDATGSDYRHLVKATYYVSTEPASRALNELRPKYYDAARPPSASKAVVAGVGREGSGLTLDMIAVPAFSAERPEYGKPEQGHSLTAQDAEDGWLSLFDGQSTFGWTGAKVEGGCLNGGATTTEFGPCAVRADFAQGGTITLAGRETNVAEGTFQLATTERPGTIRLGLGVRVRTLAIRPLGLQPIFNGRDLTGWQRIDHAQIAESKRPVWKVEDGALHAVGGPGAMEYAAQPFGDLVLQLDVRTRVRHANGGVFFRCQPGLFMMGYEAQVYNRGESSDPGRPARYSTGAIDDRQMARRLVSRDHHSFKMTVIARGSHIGTWVNGFQLTDWTDDRPKHDNPRQGLRTDPGTIQLQAHDPGTDLEFRNIQAAPIATQVAQEPKKQRSPD